MKIDLRKLFESEIDLNDNMEAVILKAIKNGSIDNASYLQFKMAVLSLKDMDMDEPTSIKSAYATLSTTGVTKEGLLESLRMINVIVDKEKEKFAVALKNQIAKQVEAPVLKEKKFDQLIAEKEAQILKLQQEIELIKQQKSEIGGIVQTAEEKINNTRDEFRAVYEHFAKTLDNDKILIDTLIA